MNAGKPLKLLPN